MTSDNRDVMVADFMMSDEIGDVMLVDEVEF